MNGCRVPGLGRVSLLRDDDYTNENETGVGDRGLHGYPVGYPFPGEGALAVATLLQLPAGNEGKRSIGAAHGGGDTPWTRAQTARVQSWHKPGSWEPGQCGKALSVG